MATTLKKTIQEIAGKKAPGPLTTFTIFHVFYALELLSEKPMGRNKLAEKLNVGDGAVRTIIHRLVDAELVETSKSGCQLTSKGRKTWCCFESLFPKRLELPGLDLRMSEVNYAFLVKNSGQRVETGIDQRDAAIIAGARKALVIVYKNGHLCIESVSNELEKLYPQTSSELLKLLKPEENDVIIIAGAETPLKAKRGAFAASWSLIH
jgi:DNA-binding MarR family transcriptional regulator